MNNENKIYTGEVNFDIGEEMNFLTPPTEPIENIMETYNDEQEMQRRLSTCMNCQYVTEDRMCTICGCPVVMMSQLNFRKCPKNYW